MAIGNEQYRVWCPGEGETEEDCDLRMAWDHEEAAKEEAERRYHDDPFQGPLLVHVRCTFSGDQGEFKAFTIHPEPAVHFYAYEVKDQPHDQ